MLSTAFTIGNDEYLLRYENKQQQDIKNNGPKRFFGDIRGHRFASAMSILDRLDDSDVQIYLIQKGLEWSDSGIAHINSEKAAELRQAYLESGEPDDGTRYEALLELLANALSRNVLGADAKKLKAKGEQAQKDQEAQKKQASVEELATIYEAKMLAEKRFQERQKQELTGTNGSETASTPASDTSE